MPFNLVQWLYGLEHSLCLLELISVYCNVSFMTLEIHNYATESLLMILFSQSVQILH